MSRARVDGAGIHSGFPRRHGGRATIRNKGDRFEREVTTDLKDTTPDAPRGWPLHTRILVGLAVGVVLGLAST